MEGHGRADKMDGFITQFRRLKSKYGVYAVPGNHEMYGGNRVDFFAQAGIRLLQDEVEKIDAAFYLAGQKYIVPEKENPLTNSCPAHRPICRSSY